LCVRVPIHSMLTFNLTYFCVKFEVKNYLYFLNTWSYNGFSIIVIIKLNGAFKFFSWTNIF